MLDEPVARRGRYHYSILRHPVARVIKLERIQGYLQHVPMGEAVLDYGSGSRPYERMLRQRFKRYVAADYAPTNAKHGKRPDIFVGEGELLLPAASVDCVLLTEVLEHIYEPDALLKDLHRVLIPSGHIVGSVPFARGHHEAPHDYYRYTRYCLERKFRDAGFEVLALEDVGDIVGTLAAQFADVLNIIPQLIRHMGLGVVADLLRLLIRVPEILYWTGAHRAGRLPGPSYLRTYPLGFTFLIRKVALFEN